MRVYRFRLWWYVRVSRGVYVGSDSQIYRPIKGGVYVKSLCIKKGGGLMCDTLIFLPSITLVFLL